MTNKNFEYEVEVIYGRSPDNDLNAKLDAMAAASGGDFVSEESSSEESLRRYGFSEEELADDFLEVANFTISRHFPIEPIEIDELPLLMKWTFEEAIYHHIEFESERGAARFSTWLRAVLGTYMEKEMFDTFVVRPVDEDVGYMVLWAFPMDSVIPDVSGDELDQELEEAMINFGSKDKKRVLN